MLKKFRKFYYFELKLLPVIVFILVSCGGGGGGSSSSNSVQPAVAPVPSTGSNQTSTITSSKLILASVALNADDTVAQLALGETSTSIYPNFYQKFLGPFKGLLNIFFPELIAQNSLNPVDLSSWNQISKKLVNGTIVDLETTYKVVKTSSSGSVIYESTSGYRCIYDPENGIFTALVDISTNQEVESYVYNEDTDKVEPEYSTEAQSCATVEESINCDTSSLPINILKARTADEKNKSLIAEIEYVESFNISGNTCIPQITKGLVLIQNEKIYNISDQCIRDFHLFQNGIGAIDELTRWWFMDYFVPANSAFNTSDKPIISRTCNPNPDGRTNNQAAVLNTMEINEYGNLLIRPLTTEMSIHGGSGKIVFNGEYLLTMSNERDESTIYKHKVGESGFSIVKLDYIDYTDQNIFSQPSGPAGLAGKFGLIFGGGALGGTTSKNLYTSMVFYNNELLIFGSVEKWGHKYNLETDEVTPLIDAWPRIISVDGSNAVRKDYSHCPRELSTESELRETGKTDCLEMPKALLNTGWGQNDILGVWNGNIIFDDIGSWNPTSFLHSGHIICLPTTPYCAAGSSNFNVLFFDYKDNYLYAINGDKNKYVRYDMNLRTSSVIDLDDFGYLADWYEVTKDNVYVTVLNAQNSNKEYVDVNFNDKTVTFLGTISEADRTVVEIFPLN